MCKVTQEHLDDINFTYDTFNPFCLQSVDPPPTEPTPEIEKSASRGSGDKYLKGPVVEAKSGNVPLESEGNLISAEPCSYLHVVVMFLFMAAIFWVFMVL